MMRLLPLSLVLSAACLDAIAPDVGPPIPAASCNDDLDPVRTVSFSTDVSPIFRRDCDRCHRPGGQGQQNSGLDLSTYASLRAGGTRSVATIVIDRQPCASILWQKTGSPPPFGARMPKDDPAMSAADRQRIHDWIAEGALDD